METDVAELGPAGGAGKFQRVLDSVERGGAYGYKRLPSSDGYDNHQDVAGELAADPRVLNSGSLEQDFAWRGTPILRKSNSGKRKGTPSPGASVLQLSTEFPDGDIDVSLSPSEASASPGQSPEPGVTGRPHVQFLCDDTQDLRLSWRVSDEGMSGQCGAGRHPWRGVGGQGWEHCSSANCQSLAAAPDEDLEHSSGRTGQGRKQRAKVHFGPAWDHEQHASSPQSATYPMPLPDSGLERTSPSEMAVSAAPAVEEGSSVWMEPQGHSHAGLNVSAERPKSLVLQQAKDDDSAKRLAVHFSEDSVAGPRERSMEGADEGEHRRSAVRFSEDTTAGPSLGRSSSIQRKGTPGTALMSDLADMAADIAADGASGDGMDGEHRRSAVRFSEDTTAGPSLRRSSSIQRKGTPGTALMSDLADLAADITLDGGLGFSERFPGEFEGNSFSGLEPKAANTVLHGPSEDGDRSSGHFANGCSSATGSALATDFADMAIDEGTRTAGGSFSLRCDTSSQHYGILEALPDEWRQRVGSAHVEAGPHLRRPRHSTTVVPLTESELGAGAAEISAIFAQTRAPSQTDLLFAPAAHHGTLNLPGTANRPRPTFTRSRSLQTHGR